MRVHSRHLALIVALTMPLLANAATTCVISKDAPADDKNSSSFGFFGKKENNECDAQNLQKTYPQIEKAINTSGTKLVDHKIITNKEKLDLPKPTVVASANGVNDAPAPAGADAGAAGTPAAAIPVPPPPPPVWIAHNKSSIRKVIGEWATRAGWHYEIKLKNHQTMEDEDEILNGGFRSEGDFQKAVTELFAALPEHSKLRADLVPDNFPPSVYIYREGEAQQ